MPNPGVDPTLVPLAALSPAQRAALAALTHEAAAEHSPGWLPTLAAAYEELDDAAPKSALVAMVGVHPAGWAAAARDWGRVWELHPLIIGVAHQRRGIGRALVRAIEAIARDAGALTLVLGTSDMTSASSLANTDLYADTGAQLAAATAHRPHPLAFWQRVGYTVVGVIPDAEGPGQPSIQLAKRLAP